MSNDCQIYRLDVLPIKTVIAFVWLFVVFIQKASIINELSDIQQGFYLVILNTHTSLVLIFAFLLIHEGEAVSL